MINKVTGAFDKDDEDLLNAFSAQAVVAIENSKLFQKTLEMSNYMQSILKSINNLVLTLDESGKFLTSNRLVDSIFGISEAEMISKNYHAWLNPLNTALADDISQVYDTTLVEAVNSDYEFRKVVKVR